MANPEHMPGLFKAKATEPIVMPPPLPGDSADFARAQAKRVRAWNKRGQNQAKLAARHFLQLNPDQIETQEISPDFVGHTDALKKTNIMYRAIKPENVSQRPETSAHSS